MTRYMAVYVLVFWGATSALLAAPRMDIDAKPPKDINTTVLLDFDSPADADQVKTNRVEGRFGKAAVRPNTDVEITPTGGLDVNQGTMEMWVQSPDRLWYTKSHKLVAGNADWCQPGNIALWLWVNGNQRVVRFDHHGLGPSAYITGNMNLDELWHHIAVTWDYRRGIKMYIDGKLVAQMDGTWKPIYLPAEKRKVFLNGDKEPESCYLDEVRLSNVAYLNQDESAIVYKVHRGETKVENGQTLLPISVEMYNQDVEDHKVAGTLAIRDYYQRILISETFNETIPAGNRKAVTLNVPTDGAGKYLITIVDLKEDDGSSTFTIRDEKFIFPDTLTSPRMQLSLNGAWDVCNGSPMQFTPPVEGQ